MIWREQTKPTMQNEEMRNFIRASSIYTAWESVGSNAWLRGEKTPAAGSSNFPYCELSAQSTAIWDLQSMCCSCMIWSCNMMLQTSIVLCSKSPCLPIVFHHTPLKRAASSHQHRLPVWEAVWLLCGHIWWWISRTIWWAARKSARFLPLASVLGWSGNNH